MVVGEYSIFSAILRMETFSNPSRTNRSRAASRISWRSSFFSRSRRSWTPMSVNSVKSSTPHQRIQREAYSDQSQGIKAVFSVADERSAEESHGRDQHHRGRPRITPHAKWPG